MFGGYILRKELPLADPPIKHLLRVAYRAAILLTMENKEHWFYTNHIQIGCDLRRKEPSMVFVYVPFITEVRNGNVRTTQKSLNKFIHRIMKLIDKGVYVLVGLDEYYMPSRPSYGINHFNHNVLIYGYDSEKQEFLIQGYSERDIYEDRPLKFIDFEKAFTYYKNTYWVSYYKNNKSRKKEKNNRTFNKKLYCHYKSIYPLYFRLFSARNFCKNMCFGMQVYDVFKMLLYQQVEDCKYNPSVLRGLLAISEQKYCIAMGYKYLSEKESELIEFATFFENLSNEYLKLRNMELKFKFSQKPEIAKRIIIKMEQLIQNEYKVLTQYFEIVGSPFKFY